ncbi:hypothetical protein Gotur_028689 [Gossypium turneri]
MFMGIVATGDKAWAPSSGTLRSDFFEDVTNEIPEMMFKLMGTVKKEKTLRYQVHILKLEERNPQSKLEGLQDCPIK